MFLKYIGVLVLLQFVAPLTSDAASIRMRATISSACSSPLDIVFAIDASVSKELFEEKIEFVRDIVKQLPIGSTDVQIGLSTFHEENIAVSFYLGEHTNQQDVISAINATQLDADDKPNIPQALKHIREEMLSPVHGKRPGIPSYVIFISDAQNSRDDQAKVEAQLLQQNNTTVISVGVGELIDDALLLEIASDPTRKYNIHNVKDLDSVVVDVMKDLCPGFVPPQVTQPTGQSPIDVCPAHLKRDRYLRYHDGICYQFVVYRYRDFWTAKQNCEDNNGLLVLIKDAAVNDYLKQQLASTYGVQEESWIGLNPPGMNNWIDGSSTEYTNWGSGEAQHERSDCAVIDPAMSGVWRSISCKNSGSDIKPYICQYQAQTTTPQTT